MVRYRLSKGQRLFCSGGRGHVCREVASLLVLERRHGWCAVCVWCWKGSSLEARGGKLWVPIHRVRRAVRSGMRVQERACRLYCGSVVACGA